MLLFPLPSEIVYVRVNEYSQLISPVIAPSECETVNKLCRVQLSVTAPPPVRKLAIVVTAEGIAEVQATVEGAKQAVIFGFSVSVITTLNTQVVVPQVFVAVMVTVVVPLLNDEPEPVPAPLPDVAPVNA